jgi:autotransporter translocation and assembly factor TamB
MKRRSLLFVLLVVALGAALWRVPVWTAGILSARLARVFNRPVTVGGVRYHLVPLQVEVTDLRIGGATPDAEPFLEVPRLAVTPSLVPLFDRRVVLTRVVIERPRVRVRAFKQGGDDLPRLSLGGPGRELQIRRLIVAGGELELDHQRVPLDLELPDVGGRLSQRRPGVLAGSFSFGPGPARFGSAPPLTLSTRMDLALEGANVTVESGTVTGDRTDLDYRGRVSLSPLSAELGVTGEVDLAILDRHVLASDLGLEGHGQFRGTVRLDQGRLRVAGRLEGTRGAFNGVAVPRYAGDVLWDEKGIRVHGLEAALLGGSGKFEIEVPPAPGQARVDARLEGIDAEDAASHLFDIGKAGVGAGATGEVSLRWPRGRRRALSGRATLDFEPREDGRTPLRGRLAWRAQDGDQVVEDAQLQTPAAQAHLAGPITIDRKTDLQVEARSTDIAAADALLVRVRRALGAPAAEPVGLAGAGVFEGRWRGALDAPVFEGRFTGEVVAYLGVRWGHAEWVGAFDAREVRPHSLVLRRPGGELWVDGRVQTGDLGDDDAIDARIRIVNWPATDLVTALGWDVELQGLVSGEAALTGRRSEAQGTVHLASATGRYYQVPYEDLDLRATLRGRVTEVTAGRARVGGGTVDFAGTVTDDGVYDGRAHAEALDVAALVPARSASLRLGGRVSGSVLLQGTMARPRVEGDLSAARLFLGDEGIGALEGRFTGTGDGRVALDARCRSSRVDLALKGSLGVAAPYEADLALTAEQTSLDPFVRVATDLSAAVGIVASGGLRLRGPLATPRALTAEADVRDLLISLPEYPVKNRAPLHLRLADGALEVRRLELSGEGTDLALAGTAALVGDGALDLTVRGSADLRALSLVSTELRGRGAARVEVAVSGTRATPVVDGTLDVEGGGVRLRGFPHGVEDVRGRVLFNGHAAHFSGVTGTVGGGPVELEGQAAYTGGRLTSFDVQGNGRGISLRYPEGLRSVLDADLRLFGDGAQQWLTGKVAVRDAVWTRRYDVATEILAAGTPVAGEGARVGGGVRYDVKVDAPGTLKIDNNLATLQARAELNLQGTYDAPVVLGRAEIDRGRVYFQGNTYVIRRGTIDFTNPQKLDPLFDIEAETRVRSYSVTLKVNGTLERVYPTLTSDPPLSTLGILSLLAGAEETAVESAQALQNESKALAGVGAATLAVGKLSEQVGLEKGAARLGLNRFSIDPTAVRGEVSPSTARMTLGKRVTPDLNIVYSQDLSGTQERLVSVEYTLSDRLSLLMTRSDVAGYGFDLRLRRQAR